MCPPSDWTSSSCGVSWAARTARPRSPPGCPPSSAPASRRCSRSRRGYGPGACTSPAVSFNNYPHPSPPLHSFPFPQLLMFKQTPTLAMHSKVWNLIQIIKIEKLKMFELFKIIFPFNASQQSKIFSLRKFLLCKSQTVINNCGLSLSRRPGDWTGSVTHSVCSAAMPENVPLGRLWMLLSYSDLASTSVMPNTALFITTRAANETSAKILQLRKRPSSG